MPITLTITGNNGTETVQEILTFLGVLQASLNTATVAAPSNGEVTGTVEPKKEAKKTKKADKEEEKAEAEPVSKTTLQDAINRAKEIAGDGKDDKVMNTLQDLNKRFGVAKVRELPPEKLDLYMEDLNKAFPKKEAGTGGMFD